MSAEQVFWKHWEMEKLLVMSNSSFSPQCFLPVWITFFHFHQIWNCQLQTLSVWKSLKCAVWERVKWGKWSHTFKEISGINALKMNYKVNLKATISHLFCLLIRHFSHLMRHDLESPPWQNSVSQFSWFNSLPRNNILELFKLKPFADNQIYVTQKLKFVF